MFDNQQCALIAVSDESDIVLLPAMANRHGLITGATGTGKTVSLQTLAETFSRMGVPVFAADIKGDLSGVAARGGNKSSVVKRVEEFKLAERGFVFEAFPVQFWDVLGEQGVPVRATVQDMGPLLLSRLLELNDTQSAVLTVLFKMAAERELELIDLKDLQKLLEYASLHAAELSSSYGNLSKASIGSIQRGVINLEQNGADKFFGEPNLNIDDIIQTRGTMGVINILAADKLMNTPTVYTTFLLWLMNKLFEVLPEVGDPDKPKLVFFFDEAHLLFDNAPKALLDKVEQVVRLIRSKGVGVFFISQVPSDLPDSVLGQLGNRIQHALRAYTPKDQKAINAAAQSFRANPDFDTKSVITELGIGEALVSFLDAKGIPAPVERAMILPPEGQLGPLDPAVRKQMTESTVYYRLYAQVTDRASAYEKLSAQLDAVKAAKDEVMRQKEAEKQRKEDEKVRREQERIQKQQTVQRDKAVSGVVRNVLFPVARNILSSLLRRRLK